ncbi:4'-phosphopantetheinyl transferase [Streptomyces sp. NPDC004435]|uniref:4'-phosphopantetheinyl transferase family protein n=1 Tax=Streptomyces sp. NPDC004435 TaxID=3364701 RepID=UPI00368D1206
MCAERRGGRPVIGGPLPAGVCAAEAFGDVGPAARVALFPAERAAVAGVSPERLREFTTVRGCARAALAGLGAAPAPLVPGPLGAPGWPPGVVGSMTHCAGYRAAVVARASAYASVGIDAEPLEPLPAVVAARVVGAAERAWLREDFPPDGPPCDRLVFSAKEAAYKAFSPWLGARFGFQDFTVRPYPDGTFLAIPPETEISLPVLSKGPLLGRWSARSGILLTSLLIQQSKT